MKKGQQKLVLERKHEGKWVALSSDTKIVVAYAKTLVALEKKVGREGIIFMKALRSDVSYAF